MSTETQRAEFEAWARSWGYQYDELDRCRIGIVSPAYYNANTEMAWQSWRAAQASQAAELATLKADIAEYVRITAEQATEIEVLKDQLASIRKWATGWSEVPYDDPWKFAAQELLSSMDMHAAMQTKEAS